jgi:hypothetical protein
MIRLLVMGFWLGVVAISGVCSFSTPGWAGGGLTALEEKRVLKAIDAECADTWCEGDYAFRFERFRCQLERRVCRLDFRAGLPLGEGGRVQWKVKTFCILHGIAGISDLLEGPSPHEHLKGAAYHQINRCIDYRVGN